MSGELVTPPGDGTTGAIYDIIHTLGEQGSEGSATEAMASGGVTSGTEKSEPDSPAGQENEELEKWLIDDWALNRRSLSQRRVLGCLGCRLAGRPGRSGMVTSREIAACTGMDNSAVRRILGRLTDSEYLFSRVTERKPDGSRWKNRPPEQFSLTRNGVRRSFKGRLEAPQECGLERTEGQLRPNAAGEKTLIEAGVFDIRGNIPRAVLGCLACKQQTDEGVFLTGIEKCQSVAHGRTLDTLRRLVDAGVLKADQEEKHDGPGKPRILYTFTNSELAGSIKENLDVPSRCGLENGNGDKE